MSRSVKVEKLSLEAFAPYGTFANLINPESEKLGEKPVEFFRDMVQLNTSSNNLLSYSICRVEKRPLVIDVLEYHTACSEGILPLDNDILVQVAPASHPEDDVPLEKVKVFLVPKGTVVVIKPGVWHWGPFTVNDDPANVLINLPERTYANDCKVYNLDSQNCIDIIH